MEALKTIQDRARHDAAKITDLVAAELRKDGILLDGNAHGAIQQIIASALVAKDLGHGEEPK